ncbi:MAG: hypothetical protein PWR16_12 [Methanoculleus sp.]|nr:hypothetical protein [Methanoculleus sp.]
MDILLVTSNLGLPESPSSNHICDRLECLQRYQEINVYGITESHPHVSCGIPLSVVENGISGRCGTPIIQVFSRIQKSSLFGRKSVLTLREILRGYRDRLSRAVSGDKADRFGNWGLIPAYEKAVSEAIRDNDFDLIYTTGGPATVHIAVAHVLEETPLPWIAEIQDPLLFEGIDGPTYAPSKRDLDHLLLAEECLRRADAVVCLTETCAEYYRERLGKMSVCSIYPGSNVHYTQSSELEGSGYTPGGVRMFHGGTLAGDRNLDMLLRAICDEGLNEQVSLTLAGYIDEGVRKQIAPLPFVHYLGVVSRDETVRQIHHSDVCLVVQNRGPVSRYTIPSKFYEYTSLSQPVLFLGYDNEEVRRNSLAYNIYYCDQRRVSEVSECLRQIISDHRSGGMRRPVNQDITGATDHFVRLCRKISGQNA